MIVVARQYSAMELAPHSQMLDGHDLDFVSYGLMRGLRGAKQP